MFQIEAWACPRIWKKHISINLCEAKVHVDMQGTRILSCHVVLSMDSAADHPARNMTRTLPTTTLE